MKVLVPLSHVTSVVLELAQVDDPLSEVDEERWQRATRLLAELRRRALDVN